MGTFEDLLINDKVDIHDKDVEGTLDRFFEGMTEEQYLKEIEKDDKPRSKKLSKRERL